MEKYTHLIIVTDCGGSDKGRYEIAARQCFYGYDLALTFFETKSMNTLHSGFTAAAHALSTVDQFGPLRPGQQTGILVNAAPRHGSENGLKLRGENRKPEGEEIYALLLRNGVWVVGPNSGFNLYFLKDQVAESYLVTDTSGKRTPFRSMEVMVPALAKIFGAQENPHINLTPKKLPEINAEEAVFVAGWDSFGNIYLVSTMPNEDWVPPLGKNRVFRIDDNIASLHHVDGIFAGKTGEQTLTVGSLKLNGKPVYYIVVVGGSALALFGNPPVGRKVEIEAE